MARPRVLVVDDTPTNLVLLERILRRGGYDEVVTTEDPRLALELFAAEPFGLVLVDLHMPHLDGLEVIGRLRSNPGGEAACFVIVTGDGAGVVGGPARAAGASAVVEKPFTPDEILAVLDGLLSAGPGK